MSTQPGHPSVVGITSTSLGWEGNRRSGVALAMRHRQSWFIHLRAQRPMKGRRAPRLRSFGVWPSLNVKTFKINSKSKHASYERTISSAAADTPRQCHWNRECCLEVTQDHWKWYHSKASVRFPIHTPQQLWPYM